MTTLGWPRSRSVMVDTSAFAALVVARDAGHLAATAIHDRVSREGWQLVATNYVLAETHALLLAREGRTVALDGLRGIDRGAAVVRATEEDEQRARAILERYRDTTFTLTDAMSFAVMERLGIGQAFTFDRHFARYGVALLEPSPPR